MQTCFHLPDLRMLKAFNGQHPGKKLFFVLITIFSLATSTAQIVRTAAGPTAADVLLAEYCPKATSQGRCICPWYKE